MVAANANRFIDWLENFGTRQRQQMNNSATTVRRNLADFAIDTDMDTAQAVLEIIRRDQCQRLSKDSVDRMRELLTQDRKRADADPEEIAEIQKSHKAILPSTGFQQPPKIAMLNIQEWLAGITNFEAAELEFPLLESGMRGCGCVDDFERCFTRAAALLRKFPDLRKNPKFRRFITAVDRAGLNAG